MDENAELDLFRESSVNQSSGWHWISKNLPSSLSHRKPSGRESVPGREGVCYVLNHFFRSNSLPTSPASSSSFASSSDCIRMAGKNPILNDRARSSR